MLASLLLLCFSAAARVRALYQPSVSTNDHLYYPLIVLPELLQQLLTSVPTLLHRTGLADSYAGWRTATWGWVARALPPAETDPEAAKRCNGGASDAKSDINSIACSADSCKLDGSNCSR